MNQARRGPCKEYHELLSRFLQSGDITYIHAECTQTQCYPHIGRTETCDECENRKCATRTDGLRCRPFIVSITLDQRSERFFLCPQDFIMIPANIMYYKNIKPSIISIEINNTIFEFKHLDYAFLLMEITFDLINQKKLNLCDNLVCYLPSYMIDMIFSYVNESSALECLLKEIQVSPSILSKRRETPKSRKLIISNEVVSKRLKQAFI